jgi:hypothetical protein
MAAVHTFNLFVTSDSEWYEEDHSLANANNTKVIPGAGGQVKVFPYKEGTPTDGGRFTFYQKEEKGHADSIVWNLAGDPTSGVHLINGDWISITSSMTTSKTWTCQVHSIQLEAETYCSCVLSVADSETDTPLSALDGTALKCGANGCTIKCLSPRVPDSVHVYLPFPLQVMQIELHEYELSNMETLPTHRPGMVHSASAFSHHDYLGLVIDEFDTGRQMSNLPQHNAHVFATLSTAAPGAAREDPATSHSVHKETSVIHDYEGKSRQFTKFTFHLRDGQGRTPRCHRAHFWFIVKHVEGVIGYC